MCYVFFTDYNLLRFTDFVVIWHDIFLLQSAQMITKRPPDLLSHQLLPQQTKHPGREADFMQWRG